MGLADRHTGDVGHRFAMTGHKEFKSNLGGPMQASAPTVKWVSAYEFAENF